MKTFKDLIVWQQAHALTLLIYETTQQFPRDEKYGLTGDLRRAVRSVPTNLVEGYKRKGYKDALNFFNRSEASLEEVKYHVMLAMDLHYLNATDEKKISNLAFRVSRLLKGWQKAYKPKLEEKTT